MPTPKRERKREGKQARQEALRRERERARRNRQIRNAAIVVVGIVVVVFIVTRIQNRGENVATEGATSTTVGETTTTIPVKIGSTECPNPDGTSARKTSFDGAPKLCIDRTKTYEATVTTDAGTFVVALDAKKAPNTVNNFVFLARYHYYDGVVFHRVIPEFVVQGGDPQGTGTGGPGYTFNDELPKQGEYKVGSLAMANSGPNTNGSQFFVVTGPEGVQLPPNYTLFGQVTAGMETAVKALEAVGTPGAGTPSEEVAMTSVRITER